MVSNSAAVSVDALRKVYRTKKGGEHVALNGISLDVPKGSFFGLLGANGAGKSTFINILAGTVNKTSGDALICGHDIVQDTRQARQALGVVPQELVLDPFFPVYEVLENTAGYYGVSKSDRRTDDIIAAVGLTDKKYAPARSLSGGMRRRLLVAKALVHNPEVLILDEPTAGVDIELRSQLWDYVRTLNKSGTTIVLTTHYLEEAEELCDHIAVIDRGNIVANEPKSSLMKLIDYKEIDITPQKPLKSLPKALEQLEAEITDMGTIRIRYHKQQHCMGEILTSVQDSGVIINDLSTQEADLEDVFRHITQVS